MIVAVLLAFAAPPAVDGFAAAGELVSEQDARIKAFWKKMEVAATEPEKDAVSKNRPAATPVCDRIMALIAGKESDPRAAPLLFWVVESVYATPKAKNTSAYKAVDCVIAHHLSHPEAGRFCSRYSYAEGDSRIQPAFRRILKENRFPTARAQAMICLATLLERQAEWRETMQSHPKFEAAIRRGDGEEAYTTLMNVNSDSARKEALQIYRAIAKDPILSAQPVNRFRLLSTVGSAAKNRLFELEHLRPGDPAPRTAGTDIRGKPFDVASLRGKVVLLQFCGNWCGPCRSEYPILRSLNEKYRNRPFAIVGVNSDEKRETAEKVHLVEKMNWPVLWDKVTDGPLHQQWNITSWPSTYLLDAEGRIIGGLSVRNPEGLKKIDESVAALEKKRSEKAASSKGAAGKSAN